MMSLIFFVFLDRSESLISLPSDIKENYQLKYDRQRPPERIFLSFKTTVYEMTAVIITEHSLLSLAK